MEWYSIEPFGEERMDLRFALMTAHLLGPHMKKGHNPKVEDYLLKFRPKRMSLEEIRAVIVGIANG